MRTLIIILMIAQVLLFLMGVHQISIGHNIGWFNVIVNFIFFFVNVNTLKKIKETDEMNNRWKNKNY